MKFVDAVKAYKDRPDMETLEDIYTYVQFNCWFLFDAILVDSEMSELKKTRWEMFPSPIKLSDIRIKDFLEQEKSLERMNALKKDSNEAYSIANQLECICNNLRRLVEINTNNPRTSYISRKLAVIWEQLTDIENDAFDIYMDDKFEYLSSYFSE